MFGTLTPEQKLTKARINLIRSPKFALLAPILTVGDYFIDDSPTARTDGRNEWYGRKFIERLPMPELMFLVAHEAGHKMWRHLWVYRNLYKTDPRLMGMACDYVINGMLHELDPNETLIKHPRLPNGERMGLFDLKFLGKDSYEVYLILKQEQQEQGGGDGEGEGGEQGDDEGGGNTVSRGKPQPGGKPNRRGQMLDDHDHKGADAIDEETKKELEREIDNAVRRGVADHERHNKTKGLGAGGLMRELEEMMNPQIKWQEALAEFVRSACSGKDMSTWSRPNRRFLAQDMLMPSMYSERVGRIVDAIDTSGSIGGSVLTAFLSEVSAQCKLVNPEGLDLLYWDSEVAGHEVYTEGMYDSLAESTQPKGGGGTSPSCVTAYMDEKRMRPDCAIVLTDGYVGSDWGGNWPCPVLWVIVDNPGVTAPTGKTVHINSTRDL